MTVDPRISINIVKNELESCADLAKIYGWEISEIDTSNLLFTVKMVAPKDSEEYIVEIKFDDYKEIPLLIDFLDPKTGERGPKNAYPKEEGDNSNFFNFHQPTNMTCICHPCSRKAYKDYSAIHTDWNMAGWQQNQQVGSLVTIGAILMAIYSRISKSTYVGRMK
jgi:hypothetical protein